MNLNLRKVVTNHIVTLGQKEASKYFGVSIGTISNWANGITSPSIDAVELVLSDVGEDIFEALTDQQSPEVIAAEAEITHWSGKDVIMLLPVYRTFSADTHFTLFANYAKYGPEKIGMIQEKRTVIHEARNILIDKFMKTDAKVAIMVDDDMILPCGNPALFNERYGAKVSKESAGLNAISRLMSHPMDKGIVGGLYFGRHATGKPQCSRGFADEQHNHQFRDGTHKGLVTSHWVGTGCIRITRECILKMKEAIDGGTWPECAPVGQGGWYGYFNPMHVRMGEDVSFGRRAFELGIQTYVDTSLVCLHNGEMNYGPHNTKG